MKRLVRLLFLVGGISALAAEEKTFDVSLDPTEGGPLVGEPSAEYPIDEYRLRVVPPDPSLDFKTPVEEPLEGVDFKLAILDPETKKQVTLPPNVLDRLKKTLKEAFQKGR